MIRCPVCIALLMLLPSSCASNPEIRRQQIEIATQIVQDQINILRPLLDEQTTVYLTIAVNATKAALGDGEVTWDSVNESLDSIQPSVQFALEQRMDPAEAIAIIASFRSALRTFQLLTLE